MAAKTPQISVESPLPWVQITPFNDPGFAAKLVKADPMHVSSSLTGVLPYSVVITNTEEFPITGIALRFTLTHGGHTANRDFFYNALSKFGKSTNVIPASESRLFTPLKIANAIAGGIINSGARADHADASGGMTAAALALQSERDALDMLAEADSIQISVDLVIANGQYAGPDKTATMFGMNRMANAYRELRSTLLSKLANGEPGDSILQWLNSFQDQKIMKGPEHRFTRAQQMFSSGWASLLKSGRRSELESQLKYTPEEMFPHLAFKGGLG